MTLTYILGLISLVSLLILLLIYILKPNYEQKFISSTFIWKLSLKYKKKKLPISKLKNILLIICQVLILTILSLILTKPVIIEKNSKTDETILIIDASASMRATNEDDESRFDRAILLAKEKALAKLDENGLVSIVVGSKKPYFLFNRATSNSRYEIEKTLTDLNLDTCTYSTSNLNDSITLCTDILNDNPNASIEVFTDQEVDNVDKGITVYNVKENGEYNVAIIDAYSQVIDNYYCFTVEVASYGQDESIAVTLTVSSANKTDSIPDGIDYEFIEVANLSNDETKRILFISSSVDTSSLEEDDNTIIYSIPDNEKIFSYESIHVSIDTEDSFYEDDSFDIYGGTKEEIKVLYASSNPNSFFTGALLSLSSNLSDRFDINFTECKNKDEIPTEGYDLYIFEHSKLPSTTPIDGIVIYADPEGDVSGSGFRTSATIDLQKNSLSLTEEIESELTQGMMADNITVSRYTTLSTYDGNYNVLMTCDNHPMIMYKNDENEKIVVMLFSLHYSNFAILKDFPIFMYNIFDLFLPATLESNSFEVEDSVTIRSRSSEVTLSGYGESETFDTFPTKIEMSIPGTYTVTQTTYFNKEISEEFYVRIPKEESNIYSSTLDILNNPVEPVATLDIINDLINYFLYALALLIFVEWLLKGSEGI